MPVVLDATRIARSLARIAHEILERNHGVEDLALVGIRRRGVPLAKRLAQAIHEIHHAEIPTEYAPPSTNSRSASDLSVRTTSRGATHLGMCKRNSAQWIGRATEYLVAATRS